MSSAPPVVRPASARLAAARVLSLLVLTLCCAVRAYAQDPDQITVRTIEFTGITAIDESDLRSVLATRHNSRLPWGDKYPFDRNRLEADLKRIAAYYADRGFPDARATLVNLVEDDGAVSIAIAVQEGEPIRVSGIVFEGVSVVPPDRLDQLREQSPLRIGLPRDRRAIATTRELTLNELRDQGYPSPRVSAAEADDPATPRSVVITFTAEPGTRSTFGPVEIVGNTSVGQRVIERQLLFRPGDQYRRSVVQDSQRGLYNLQLFQFVNVETQVPDDDAGQVLTRVTVVEGRHQRLNFGVGYGTEEKWRTDGSYRHVNFFGGARTAVVDARWSSLDRGVRAEIHQPYFFDPQVSLAGEGQHWFTFTPAYDSAVTGGRLTVNYRFNRFMMAAVSVVVESSTSTISDEALNDPSIYDDLIAIGLDPRTNEQAGTITPVALEFQRSTADSLLDPTTGYQIVVRTENAGRLVPGDFKYLSMLAEGRYYVPLGDRFVLAQRVQLATVDEGDDDPANVPFSKRLFLGGATSIRGWGRFEISPLSSGLPIGGQTLGSYSVEARAQLGANVGAVLFLDTGNVWLEDWSADLADLRSAVGLGVRYNTPVGPIRFDFGYQLNPIDGLLVNGAPQERRYRLHFSIGQAF